MKETLRIRLLLGASYYAGGVLALFYCFMISVTFSQLEGKVNLFACVISTCTLLLHNVFQMKQIGRPDTHLSLELSLFCQRPIYGSTYVTYLRF